MITLLSTEGCHLCEQAYQLLQSCGLQDNTNITDIAFDDELFLRYGVTIPVVKVGTSELGWPFDLEELQNWLDKNGITYHS